MMRHKSSTALVLLALAFAHGHEASAQSGATRPRRVNPTANTPPVTTTSAAPRGDAATTGGATPARASARPSSAASSSGDTTRAYELFQRKQFDAALAEARRVTDADPKNSEGWKLAGFAEMELRRYGDAATSLQRALELQRAAGEEDPNTSDALATAYVRAEKYAEALPLLVAQTTRKGAKPDAISFYYRGLAESRTGKTAEAERSFTEAVRLDPKNSASLFYLGRFAFDRKDDAAAIAFLNRATTANPQLADAWMFLTYAYLRRAAAAGGEGPKADADYLSAVRSSESLMRVRPDESAAQLQGQALVGAKQYARAALALEKAAAADTAQGPTLYLLGFAHTQAKANAKAVAALERAASKSPDDANVYRLLGYNYEVLKQYAKALTAYERGAQLAPDDAYFKESAERVRPFAK
jgi:tetratricopeptide (TPR) repeat protein